jgi:hypothetical protein
MIKAIKSINTKDLMSPKSGDSHPYFSTNQRLKLQEKPSPTKPMVAEAISDLNDMGNSFSSKALILETNQISQGEENVMVTNRYSSENLTDEEHESRGVLGSTAKIGVSLKRDTENLYYAQNNYSKFLQIEMRAISPTSAHGEENNQIGIVAMRRSVRKNPQESLFNRRYSAVDSKS